MKFGIICEGVTDFHVLKHVIQAYFDDPVILPIQPNLDETHNKTATGTFGGWELVAKYLKSDHFEDAILAADFVVVQIDTDVCEHINFGVAPISLADSDHQSFYENIRLKLIEWMDSYAADTYDFYKDKIIFAISVHSLECWLLAYHGTKKCKITGCDTELSAVMRKKKKSLNTVTKNVQEYIEHSRDLRRKRNHPSIIAKSLSFEKFIQQLSFIKIKGMFYFIPDFNGFAVTPFLKNFM